MAILKPTFLSPSSLKFHDFSGTDLLVNWKGLTDQSHPPCFLKDDATYWKLS